MARDDLMPPELEFVTYLEERGATLTFRPGSREWHLNLDGVVDMTMAEAERIVAAAFEIRDGIRAVLQLRAGTTVH